MEKLVNSELVMPELAMPELAIPKLVPLVYNNSCNGSTLRNIMLIDSTVTEAQLFYDSANSNTFPIKYSYTSQKTELLELLRNKFLSGIDRISFVFHDPSVLEKAFLDNSCFFVKDDLLDGQTTFSENVLFLTSLVNEFNITHFDFLACNTLQYDNWKQYYDLLFKQNGVICGASNDATGNFVSGADWVMENTQEDIKNIYFNNNIENYASTLAETTISQSGGTIYIRNGDSNSVEYSTDNISWTNIGSNYPINIQNTNPTINSVLTVEFTSDLTIDNVNAYFICASSYITFDGKNKNITFSGITNYLGLIQNGRGEIDGERNGYHTITIKNINTLAINNSSLRLRSGWLCQAFFGYNIKNIAGFNSLTNLIQILNCSNSAPLNNDQCASICGRKFGVNGIITITNCSNSGTMTALYGGGIVGIRAGENGGIISISGCTNSGVMTGQYSAGICGALACALGGGTLNISDCSNSGAINNVNGVGICGQQAGEYGGIINIVGCRNSSAMPNPYSAGICGLAAGRSGGTINISDCSNSGVISGLYSAGICGGSAGQSNGIVTITGCFNTGNQTGESSGGICGRYAGETGGRVTINKSYSTGNISIGKNSGAVAGEFFGYQTDKTCSITNSYSIGAISSIWSGGICGPSVGFSTTSTLNPYINITNCYALGSIAANCGGILGASDGNLHVNRPIVTLLNCYTSGTVTNVGSGLIANGLDIKSSVIVNNCYIANGSWIDTNANASLTGEPVSHPGVGATWTSLAINTPYLLSAYNNTLYSPNNVRTTFPNYTTNAGLQTGSTYAIINNSSFTTNSIVTNTGVISYTNLELDSTKITNVVAYNSASSANYYYGYNINNFTITYKVLVPIITNFSILPKTYGTAPFQINPPTSNSSGSFSYTSSNTLVATIVGDTITIVSAGSSIITATQAPNGDYTSGTISTTFQVNKANPIITYESTLFQIVPPTSTSQGAFSYTSSDTSVATISGITITIIGIGSSIITTIQEETENYSSGISTILFNINKNSESNPIQITNSEEFIYFFNTPATYAELNDNIIVNNPLTVSVNSKVLVNGSSSFITMSFE